LNKEDWNSAIVGVNITTPPQPGLPPYTDATYGSYAVDPWGSSRHSIGGFWNAPVTSTYYVNLEGGNGEGTEESPIGHTQFFSLINTSTSPLTFYLRGYYIQNDRIELNPSSGTKLLPWDQASGPWVIGVSGWVSNINLSGMEIKGGMFLAETSLWVSNCLISTTVLEAKQGINGSDSTCKGCTFSYYGNGSFAATFNNSSFIDSVFPHVVWGENSTNISFEGCACSDDPPGSPDQKHNSQFNWKAPVYPGGSRDKKDWAKALLLDGVHKNVARGTPPYSGYDLDFWGSPRNSIGTVSTVEVPVARQTVTSDSGSGSRSSGNGTLADYIQPWWLDVRY
jgi:hypothetical protein